VFKTRLIILNLHDLVTHWLKVHIIYFYQYFSTPGGSWGTRVYEFASEWVKNGHKVTVVSSVYSKSDLKVSKLLETLHIEGIEVRVVNVLIDNKQSFLKRVYSFLAYAFWASWYALRLPADVVIASSGPITVGIPGLVARYLRGRKLVFEARDLWPEGAIELGVLRNKTLQKLAYWFERRCYKGSSLIVGLSPGIKSRIESKHSHPNVISITNAANIELFATPIPFDHTGELQSKKYAIYTGNIGEVNNAVWMLETAKVLKERGRDDIQLLLIGDGQQKEWIKIEVERYQLQNLLVWDLMPKHELVTLVQNAMVSLVPLKGTPVLDTSSPNKFFESLAAGVPVIQNTNGWMRDFIEEHRVGYTIDPNDSLALAECLIQLSGAPELLVEMGNRGQKVAREQFDKRILADKMLTAIEEIAR
jgi:glycosyltransferase involved in cell wall biosynthesis